LQISGLQGFSLFIIHRIFSSVFVYCQHWYLHRLKFFLWHVIINMV